MAAESVWHDDGHQIHLELNKEEVVVTTTSCPNKGECRHPDTDCVVQWFIERYGLGCNVGVCEAAPSIEIAWTLEQKGRDIDSCQLWFIPADDHLFAAWATAERQQAEPQEEE